MVRAAKSGASNIVEIDGDAQSVRNTDDDDNYSEHFRYTNRAKWRLSLHLKAAIYKQFKNLSI